jgi:hypothetical protein
MNGQPNPRLHIFISHRHADARAAEGFKKKLSKIGGAQVYVFVSEDIRAGEDWYKKIQDNLSHARLLLLLYTVEDQDWS